MKDPRHLIAEQIPRLRRYARALVGDRHAADDLTQDTLERAWSRLRLWRRGSDLRAWLFSIMHNVYVNQLRSRKREALWLPIEDTPEALEVGVAGNQAAALEMRDLQAALARLPAEQREVLLLVGLEQMRYEEVAEILQVPLGTVMSRLSRGRERLRVSLAAGSEPGGLKVVK